MSTADVSDPVKLTTDKLDTLPVINCNDPDKLLLKFKLLSNTLLLILVLDNVNPYPLLLNADIFCISTLNYNGFDINVFENKGNNIFKDATKQIIDVFSDKISFPNFYNIRFIDVDSDGDFDMVPDQIANWGGFKYTNNLHWENVNGYYIRKNL